MSKPTEPAKTTESTSGSAQAAAKAAPSKPPGKPAAEARPLPSQEQIESWVRGEDLPTLSLLFDLLVLKRFDGLMMQIRKEELVPQHWQVISDRSAVERDSFSSLPIVRRLRSGYDERIADPRLAALEIAWEELGGKQPSLWSVADLFAAHRRILEHDVAVDYHDLYSATRDVWRSSSLPHGRNQLEALWACLSFIRTRTKK